MAIYGSGLIYKEDIYKSELTNLIISDFDIDVYSITTSDPVTGYYWKIYKRDPSISQYGIIDESHILLDNGYSLDSLLRIKLGDYSLRNEDGEYLIIVSESPSSSPLTDQSRVQVKYYYQNYITNDNNSPYLYNRVGIVSDISMEGGYIEIEPNKWQMVSIPVRYGYYDQNQHKLVHDGVTEATIYNYIVLQIEDVYQEQCSDKIEVFNTYRGNGISYLSFVPGVTDPNSKHNFKLAYVDNGRVEYSAFWIKSKSNTPFVIKWGVAF